MSDFIRLSEHLVDGDFSYAYAVSAADLTGSGSMDLVVCDTNVGLFWFENDGAGNFTRHVIRRRTGEWIERHSIVDIDGRRQAGDRVRRQYQRLHRLLQVRWRPARRVVLEPPVRHRGRAPRRIRPDRRRSRRRRRHGRRSFELAYRQPLRLVREPRRRMGASPDRGGPAGDQDDSRCRLRRRRPGWTCWPGWPKATSSCGTAIRETPASTRGSGT